MIHCEILTIRLNKLQLKSNGLLPVKPGGPVCPGRPTSPATPFGPTNRIIAIFYVHINNLNKEILL